jgi:phosphoglycolate phosphatase
MDARGLPGFARPEVAAMVGDGAPALVTKALAARGRVADAAAIAEFLADYGAHAADATRPFPDVPETLAALRERGWRLAVCTNKPLAPTRSLLDRFGLTGLFGAIGAGDSFPVRKPDPGHLLATLALLGAAPDAAVMVGDHRNDVVAATGAGLASVFALWGYGPPESADGATATAARFADLPDVVDRLIPPP